LKSPPSVPASTRLPELRTNAWPAGTAELAKNPVSWPAEFKPFTWKKEESRTGRLVRVAESWPQSAKTFLFPNRREIARSPAKLFILHRLLSCPVLRGILSTRKTSMGRANFLDGVAVNLDTVFLRNR